ncbi:MAG: hypothetical protein NWF07_13430 [Candidatus Bathyarchaeota archaeon]|nr:hypothetical protein [Candidatus Bathyarchaeota archaeon]
MAYKTYLLRLMKPSTFRRNLSFVEAVQGVPGTSISSLDNTTSPGFPYNYEKIKRDQIYKINEKGEFVPGPLWKQLVSDAQVDVKLMCHDHVPAYVFSDNLKMELRAPEKVDKPRMIAGAPLLHTFLSRIHFGAFMAFMSDNNGLNDVLIGADPHVDWDFYQRKMTSISDGVRECFGDFSGFDTSRAPEMMDFVAEIANAFYGDAPDSPVGRVRHWLVRSCIVSVHMYAKVLEQVSSGWCSGALLTGLGNSMFNTWAHVYAAVKTAKDAGEDYHLVAAEYFSNVYLKVMGDDCGMGVSKEFEFHNNASIAKVLGRDLALTYTSVKKSIDVVPFDPPEDRTLLKRESIFCEEDGVFYGCLQIEVILNMVCYTKRGDEIVVMRQRGDNAIKELAFRPKADWEKCLPIILKKLGPLYVYRGYHQKELRRSCLIGWFTQSSDPTSNVVKLMDEVRVTSDLEAKTTSRSPRNSPFERNYECCGCNPLAPCLERQRNMKYYTYYQRQCAGTNLPYVPPPSEKDLERARAKTRENALVISRVLTRHALPR